MREIEVTVTVWLQVPDEIAEQVENDTADLTFDFELPYLENGVDEVEIEYVGHSTTNVQVTNADEPSDHHE